VKFQVCGPQELKRRIWRAQVAVLFGWLEEMRLAFIGRIAPALKNVSADTSSWEWSELSYRLRGDHQQFAERCRHLRNRLAHREPIAWQDFQDVLRRAERLDLHAEL
jgi:hypothetical protein